MQVRTYLLKIRKCVHKFIRQILRMRCYKPYTLQTFYIVEGGQEFVQRYLPAFRIVPVRVNILPEQYDFFHSGGNQCIHFVYDIPRMPAYLPAAKIRHGTVRAEIVAPFHDRNKGLYSMNTLHRVSEALLILIRCYGNNGPVCLSLIDKLIDPMNLRRSDNNI